MMKATPFTLICDTREPWRPHPWEAYLPEEISLRQGTLDVGDFSLADLDNGAVVERKTVPDFLACLTSNRERFEKELRRARHLSGFAVVIEGSLQDCMAARHHLHPAALVGTVAAWSRRYAPIVFAGNPHCAASFAWRFLVGQIKDAEKLIGSAACASPQPTGQSQPI